MNKTLSPAAQAVYEAWIYPAQFSIGKTNKYARRSLAAALRAAADQVVPEMQEPDWGSCVDMHCDIELYTDHQRKRSTLLAIAAELKGDHG